MFFQCSFNGFHAGLPSMVALLQRLDSASDSTLSVAKESPGAVSFKVKI